MGEEYSNVDPKRPCVTIRLKLSEWASEGAAEVSRPFFPLDEEEEQGFERLLAETREGSGLESER